MIDPNQRRMNWQIETDTTEVRQRLDDRRPDMLKRYEAAVASLCEMETKARQVLNSAGVQASAVSQLSANSTSQSPQRRSFGRA